MEINALIIAGGEGKRFWPLSTKSNPKQFLSLIGDKSLIRQTVDRILPLIPIENIYIVTGDIYADQTLEHLPDLPKQNIILEPVGKNTAPCIAYGELKIKMTMGESITVVLPADHVIGDDEHFLKSISFAASVAQQKLQGGKYPLITLGITPRTPETGYGYIKTTNSEVASSDDLKAMLVEKFTEKPDLETAQSFLEQGGFYWNSGIFVWKTSSILDAFAEIKPDWHNYFEEISNNIGALSERDAVNKFFNAISGGSIDKLILEHSDNTVVISINFPWSDIGSWYALDEYLRGNTEENLCRGEVISIDSTGCMVFNGDKTVALVGVEDLVVVESKGSILILNKEKSQEVKKVVEELNKSIK